MYVSGGNVDFAAGTTVTITSSADPDCRVGENEAAMFDGVYVQNGSLTANGTFTVFHNVNSTGVSNDYSGNYNELVVRSYAVRVEGKDIETDKVIIEKGVIENSVGGGLYVSGGTVTIGNAGDTGDAEYTGAESEISGLWISAKGYEFTDEWYDINGGNAGGSNAWHYHKNITGGHAVEVVGGELFINGGRYTAAMGNGILVQGGTATVNNGTFIGADAYTPRVEGSAANAGPAASYAFKMYGGDLIVKGGTFTDQMTADTGNKFAGSGAFVMGGSATILGGEFHVKGTSAFAVYSGAIVTFGAESGNDNSKIRLSGESAGVTIENTEGESGSSVTVWGGSYWCNTPKDGKGSDGIYYGEGTTQLLIYGGLFNGTGGEDTVGGTGRSGLYLAEKPGEGKIEISDGTFIGKSVQERGGVAWQTDYYKNGAIGADCSLSAFGNWGKVGGNVLVKDIIAQGHTATCESGYVKESYISDNDSRFRLGESLAGANKIIVT